MSLVQSTDLLANPVPKHNLMKYFLKYFLVIESCITKSKYLSHRHSYRLVLKDILTQETLFLLYSHLARQLDLHDHMLMRS